MATVTDNSTKQGETNTCANPGCNCKVRAGDKYCSDSCEKPLDGEPCSCGHAACQHEHKEAS